MPDPVASWTFFGIVLTFVVVRHAYKLGYDKSQRERTPPAPPPVEYVVYKPRPRSVRSGRKARPTAASK